MKSTQINQNVFLKNYLYIIIFTILGFLIYGNSLLNNYALDDAIVITQNEFTKKGIDGIPDLLTTEGFTGFFGKQKDLVAGGRYRPLSLVTFAIEYQFFGENPFISHLINIILYILTTILLFQILLYFFPESLSKNKYINIPFITSILFLAHPIHTEIVANIKGRDEILTLLGSLAALYYSIKYLNTNQIKYLIFSFIVMFLALMSKENAITFLAIIPLSIYYFTKNSLKRNLTTLIPIAIASLIYLVLRNKIIGFTIGASADELMNNPYLYSTVNEKFATVFYTMLLYIKLLIAPTTLTFDYYPFQIPIINWSDFRAILSILIYLALGIFALLGFKKKTIISYGIWFYLITFSVVSNLIFNVGTFMNERFMYISSIGFFIIIAFLIVKYLINKPKIGFTILGLILVLYSAKTISRNFAWENDYVLFTTDVENSPNSAKGNTSAGGKSLEVAGALKKIQRSYLTDKQLIINALKETPLSNSEIIELTKFNSVAEISNSINKKIDYLQQKSLKHLEKAVKLHTTYNDALLLLGNARFEINPKDIDGVWSAYKQILDRNPTYFRVYQNLGIILTDSINVDKRIKIWSKLLKYDKNNFEAHYQLGHIYGMYKNNLDSAIYFLTKATTIDKNSEKAYKDLGVAYGISMQYQKALEAMNKAFFINPKDYQLLLNIGITYMQLKDFKPAIQTFEKALSLNPQSQEAFSSLIISCLNGKEYDKTINLLLPIYKTNPNDFNVNYNLGVCYQGKGDNKTANTYLNKAKNLNPIMFKNLISK